VCAYHGWRFESSGSCSTIPQALDPKAAETACASQRSCATVFPTQEAGGLLWVWPDESRDAAAQAQGVHRQRMSGQRRSLFSAVEPHPRKPVFALGLHKAAVAC
jgi:phenylpropionate dioxygenase-like ring-hydroxylating dioxygenase large terminal subunit